MISAIVKHFNNCIDFVEKWEARIRLLKVLKEVVGDLHCGTFKLILTGSVAYGASTFSGDNDFAVNFCGNLSLSERIDKFNNFLFSDEFNQILKKDQIMLKEVVTGRWEQNQRRLCQTKFLVEGNHGKENVFYVEFSFHEGINCGALLSPLRAVPDFYILCTCLKSFLVKFGLIGSKKGYINGITIALLTACSLKNSIGSVRDTLQGTIPDPLYYDKIPAHRPFAQHHGQKELDLKFIRLIDFFTKWNYKEYLIDCRKPENFIKRTPMDGRFAFVLLGFGGVNTMEEVVEEKWKEILKKMAELRGALKNAKTEKYESLTRRISKYKFDV